MAKTKVLKALKNNREEVYETILQRDWEDCKSDDPGVLITAIKL